MKLGTHLMLLAIFCMSIMGVSKPIDVPTQFFMVFLIVIWSVGVFLSREDDNV